MIDGHTSWLVHFVPGPRDTDDEDYFEDDEDSNSDRPASPYAGPFATLWNALAAGGLFPDDPLQGGRTPIFGGQAVVSATELPLCAFAKYAQAHDGASSPSPLGVAFLKSEFYAAGGRPVIYGLSGPPPVCTVDADLERLLPESALPVAEQYRYVPYVGGGDPWLEQIRQREWRWRVTDEARHLLACADEEGHYADIYGLPLCGPAENGCHFTKTRFIVWDEAQARELQEIATCLYLVEATRHEMPISRDTLQASGVVTLDQVIEAAARRRSFDGDTVESLEAAKLVDPLVRLLPSTRELAEKVRTAVAHATRAGELAAEAYLAKYPADRDAAGAAVITSYEILNEAVQCLAELNIADIYSRGKISVRLDGQWPIQQSISYSEAICKAAAKVLENELGVPFYVERFMD